MVNLEGHAFSYSFGAKLRSILWVLMEYELKLSRASCVYMFLIADLIGW